MTQLRRVFVLGLALAPSLAAAIALRCISPTAVEVPCKIWLIPSDPALPVEEVAGGQQRVLPDGAYFIRAQHDAWVQPGPAAVTIQDDELEPGKESRSVRLRPGARVEVPTDRLPAAGALHMMSLDTGALETIFLSQRNFTVLPAGQAIAVGLNGPEQVAGITRPFDIVAGRVAVVPPFSVPSAGHGHVTLSFQFPREGGPPIDDLRVRLQASKGEIAAAAEHSDRAGLHWAVFYDVPVGAYDSVVSSNRWQAEHLRVVVANQKLSFLDPTPLFPRSHLTLTLLRGGELHGKSFATSLYRLLPENSCDPLSVDANQVPLVDHDSATLVAEAETANDSTTFDGLEAGCYLAVLRCAGHTTNVFALLERSDLEAVAHLAPTFVSGTVSWSGLGGPARLRFVHLNDRITQAETESDGFGSYQATLWQSGPYAVTILPTEAGPKAEGLFIVPAGVEAIQKDFDVPAETRKFHIVDHETGKAIAGATACCIPDPTGLDSQKTSSDETGHVEVRLLRTKVNLSFSADGYQTTNVDVDGSTGTSTEQEVQLRKPRDELSFTALLPGGAPAAGARVFVLPPGVPANDIAHTIQFSCDDMGLCKLASRYPNSQQLTLVHPEAAITTVTTADALASGVANLLRVEGVASVHVTRGDTSRSRMLYLLVSYRGYMIPTAALELANVLSGGIATAAARLAPGLSTSGHLRATLLPGGPFSIAILAEAASLEAHAANAAAGIVMNPTESWVPQVVPLEAVLK